MTRSERTAQLTFDIAPRHAGGEPAGVIGAELKLAGAFAIDVDVDHGTELVVTIAGADGELLSRHHVEVSAPPSFVPVEDEKVGLIGYVRSAKTKIVDRLA